MNSARGLVSDGLVFSIAHARAKLGNAAAAGYEPVAEQAGTKPAAAALGPEATGGASVDLPEQEQDSDGDEDELVE